MAYKLSDLLASVRTEDLAAATGVCLSTVSRWKRGLSKPSPLAMRELNRILKKMNDEVIYEDI